MDANENKGFSRPILVAAMSAFLLIPLSAVSAVQPDKTAPSPEILAHRIAERYGADAFSKVNCVQFTFNVDVQGKHIKREWTWFPKEDSVLFKGEDAKGVPLSAAYSRRNKYSMGSESIVGIDKSFINDQYWLLFPLHLGWDKDLKLETAPGVKPGEAWRLTVMYPSQGGYTPGDAYDLFVDSAATIKRWIFRKGNASMPTNQVYWSAPSKMGLLDISMEHPGVGKDFKLWFSDVKVSSGPT